MPKLVTKTLYAQARLAILGRIEPLNFMDKLPSEQELSYQLGVSRNTVREAIKSLENEGVLASRHGIGTFVLRAKSSLTFNIATLDSTTRIIQEQGYHPGTQGLFYEVRPTPEFLGGKFESPAPETVLYIERIRTADNQPVVFVEDYIPYAEHLLEDFSAHSEMPLFEFLTAFVQPVSFADCALHAVSADRRLMKKLDIPSPIPLLLLRQIHYSAKGHPVFYSDSYFMTNKIEFNLIRRCIE